MTDYLNHYSIFDYQGINHISDETPIFPSGEGLEISLINLANYPYKTEFYEIETVGAIVTFLTTQRPKNNEENKWDENNFHIAIYVDDIIELSENGYVEGIIPISK